MPKIETERLVLSQVQAADIPQIVQGANNKAISQHTQNIPFPYSESDAIYWIKLANQGFKDNTHFIFGIRLKEQAKFIGSIGLTVEHKFLRAEIGYWISERFWNKGYATEAIIRFGFNSLGLNKLTASYFEENEASGKVMLNLWDEKRRRIERAYFLNESLSYFGALWVNKGRF